MGMLCNEREQQTKDIISRPEATSVIASLASIAISCCVSASHVSLARALEVRGTQVGMKLKLLARKAPDQRAECQSLRNPQEMTL